MPSKVNISIPCQFELMNRTWQVKWMTDEVEARAHDSGGTSPIDVRLLGLCDAEEAVIYIKKTKSKDSMMHTFLHELVHAMWASCRMDRDPDQEERDADLVGGALHQFLKSKQGTLR